MSEKILNFTSYFFLRPSISRGIGQIFDFSSLHRRYNFAKDANETDSKVLLADWLAVGSDLEFSIANFDKELCLGETKGINLKYKINKTVK